MPIVAAACLPYLHSNTAVLLWTGGENIRFFAAVRWLVFRKPPAVRAKQQTTMQAVLGQFSSGHCDKYEKIFDKYQKLKKEVQLYLEDVKLAPEKVRAFLDTILPQTRQTRQHEQPVHRKLKDMEL